MEQAAFLEAIRQTPGDLTLRRVYADWLDERNDPLAGYIRSECDAEASPAGSPEWVAAVERMAELVQAAGMTLGGWEYEPILERLRRKIARVRAAVDPPLLEALPFALHGLPEPPGPVPEAELLRCELRHGVTLPGEYRAFLLRVGNEQGGPAMWSLRSLYLSAELRNRTVRERHNTTRLRRVDDGTAWAGDLDIAYGPSNEPYYLRVLGPARGQIWGEAGPSLDNQGRAEGFFAWYEVGLDLSGIEFGIGAEE
jgi:uncharacterized protein (TIGR02996 family)